MMIAHFKRVENVKSEKQPVPGMILPYAPAELSDEAWEIYQELFGIEYGKQVQDLLRYRFPEQYWPALQKDALSSEEAAFIKMLPLQLGEATMHDPDLSFFFCSRRPIEEYRHYITNALDKPKDPLQKLLVGYCCWRINEVKQGEIIHKWPF